jgi:hypothetical protein
LRRCSGRFWLAYNPLASPSWKNTSTLAKLTPAIAASNRMGRWLV